VQGGYSQAIVVDEAYTLKIPDNLDLAAAAPLLCAGITVWSPLVHYGVRSHHAVGVVGLGGLGALRSIEHVCVFVCLFVVVLVMRFAPITSSTSSTSSAANKAPSHQPLPNIPTRHATTQGTWL
jgi:hypothetical protein